MHTVKKGSIFERRVANLFELLGYGVKVNELIAGRQIDVVIKERKAILSNEYAVECKDLSSAFGVSDFDSFHSKLSAIKASKTPKFGGIIVTTVGFTKEVKSQADSLGIELLTISDLEKSILDFTYYIPNEKTRLENEVPLEHFIEPTAQHENTKIPHPIISLINKWILDPEMNHLTLLGDYGSGKTTVLKKYCYELLLKYIDVVINKGGRARIPIFIDLKKYHQAISLKQIVLDLFDTYSIKLSSYPAFEFALEEGQILLVLDGFDEMVSRGNYQVTLKNFKTLINQAKSKAKIILSCRTHYFISFSDIHQFHSRNDYSSSNYNKKYTDLYREIVNRDNFQILFLNEFDETQVNEYLKKRLKSSFSEIRQFINETYNLKELCTKPVLLDIITTSGDKLRETEKEISPGLLYEIYTDIWLSKNDWSSSLDKESKLELLEHLAMKSNNNPDFTLGYDDIQQTIDSWIKDASIYNQESIDRELRTASFLVTDLDNSFRFSHKSFQEFFYSKYLMRELSHCNFTNWNISFFKSEIYRFIIDITTFNDTFSKVFKRCLEDAIKYNSYFAVANLLKCSVRILDQKLISYIIDNLINKPHKSRQFAVTVIGYSKLSVSIEILKQILLNPKGYSISERSNAFISLCRINNGESSRFLTENIKRYGYWHLGNWSVAKGLLACNNESIVDTFFNKVKTSDGLSKRTCSYLLDVCKKYNTDSSKAFCKNIFINTKSIINKIKCIEVLPELKESNYKELIGSYPTAIDAKSKIRIISTLHDLKKDDIRDFCIAEVNKRDYNSSLTAHFINLLSKDYPNTIIDNYDFWINPYNESGLYSEAKLELIGAYVRIKKVKDPEYYYKFLRTNRRYSFKETIYELLKKNCDISKVEIANELWKYEKIPAIKCNLLKDVFYEMNDDIVSFIESKCFKESLTAVRVYSCEILGSISTKVSTELLYHFLKDDSKWVRKQAVNSICVPGNSFDKSKIDEILQSENDDEVISIVNEKLKTAPNILYK